MRRILVVVLLGAALGGAACGGDEEYPAEARKNFVDSCVAQDGATRSACDCALEKVQENVSYKEFRRAEAAIAAGLDVKSETQDALLDAITDCRE